MEERAGLNLRGIEEKTSKSFRRKTKNSTGSEQKMSRIKL